MKSRVLFAASFLFGAVFINAGLNKFFNYMPMPEKIDPAMVSLSTALMETGWFMPLLALVEIVGGLLFIFTKTRALAAVMILPIMVGIFLIHLIQDRSGLLIAAILFCINIWVIFENKHKYQPMIEN